MKKVCVVGSSPLLSVMEGLRSYGEQHGLKVDLVEAQGEELPEGFDLVVCDLELGARALQKFSLMTPTVGSIRCFDSLFDEQGKKIPRLVAFEALSEALVKKTEDVDIRHAAYIIGNGCMSAVAAAVCAHLGFQDVCLVGHSLETLNERVEQLSRHYFGVRFTPVLAEDLTVHKLPGSLMINTMDLKEDEALLGDLSYFNFMTRAGVVLDISFSTAEQQLLRDAKDADLRVLSSQDYSSFLLARYLDLLFQHTVRNEDELRAFLGKDNSKNPTPV